MNAPQAAMSNDQHQASKAAAQASVEAEDPDARTNAMDALDHSLDGDGKGAAKVHGDAATAHEEAAGEAMEQGDRFGAARHQQAAALHKRAASLHAAASTKPGEKMTGNDRKNVISFLVTNCECGKVANSKTLLGNLSDEALSELVLSAGKRRRMTANEKAEGSNADVIGAKGTSVQAGDEEDSDDHDYKSERGKGLEDKEFKKPPIPGANQQQLGYEEWLSEMKAITGIEVPQIIQNAVKTARAVETREKMSVIEHIISNVREANAKESYTRELLGKTLPELHRIAALIPQQLPRQITVPSYLGAAAPLGVNRQTPEDKEDILPLPVLNYSEESNVGKLLANAGKSRAI